MSEPAKLYCAKCWADDHEEKDCPEVDLPPKTNSKPSLCRMCPAYSEPGPVEPSIPPNPSMIVCGEAPGDEEVARGEGFVGPSGGLLWRLLAAVGIHRKDCIVMNVAKCNTKAPHAFEYCHATFTRAIVEQFPSLPVLALGNEAKKALAPGLKGFGIQLARGCMEGRVMAALHPAFIHRTRRHVAEGSGEAQGDKQDLSPTIPHDAIESYHALPRPTESYQHSIDLLPPPAPFFSCDLETSSRRDGKKKLFDSYFNGQICDVGFGTAWGSVQREKWDDRRKKEYQNWLISADEIVFHNMTFDLAWLRQRGLEVREPQDTMLAAHLLNPDLPLTLEFQNSLFVHYPPWKSLEKKKNHDRYHALDLDITWQLWLRQKQELKERGLWALYRDEVRPVTLRCLDMKMQGIKIDRSLMEGLNKEYKGKVQAIDLELKSDFPEVNWNSSKQVMKVLYEDLRLPRQFKQIKGGAQGNLTSDQDALAVLSSLHPLPKKLLERRSYEKIRSTYTQLEVDPLGFFHHELSFTAATGRARGFLLTIPRPGESPLAGMRKMYVGDREGWRIAYLDWNQVEWWISAVCSGDLDLQRVLSQMKIHAYAAAECFGGPATQANPKYSESKRITYGLSFGRGARAIQLMHGIPQATTNKLSKWMNDSFPRWAAWRNERLREATEQGYLINAFGFSRSFWSGNMKGLSWSFDPQSNPAHMIKRVILQLWPQLPKPARIVAPIHDALVLTYPAEIEQSVLKVAKEAMEMPWAELGGWHPTCSIGTGENWFEASDD